MSKVPRRPPSGIILVAVTAIIVMVDAAFYQVLFDALGTTMGALALIGGSLYLIACLYWMERSR